MIKIVCVGKVKDRHLSALIDDYVSKIAHYHKIEVIEVKDEPIKDNEKAVLDKEAEAVLSRIRDDE
ncbi:MAG: 23S rRNA (pseudouridine(1915)-N(3))-methyltransferase RlmH, partial [Erysipelotrichaceae bacterium]|nr:23S rRNA (pseudouridine(1915)-N(3))-methyltransferase RlmH [Erysipelotrichaceae bacterium]